MTELQADLSVAARLQEGGSLRRALRPRYKTGTRLRP